MSMNKHLKYFILPEHNKNITACTIKSAQIHEKKLMYAQLEKSIDVKINNTIQHYCRDHRLRHDYVNSVTMHYCVCNIMQRCCNVYSND